MDAHRGPICAVAIAPDGKVALSTGANEGVKVWDLRSGPHLVRTLDSGEFPIRHLHVIGGAELCVASSSNAFFNLESYDGTQVRSVIHAPTITAFDATPNGKWIITGSADGALRLFDADDGQQRVQLDNPHGINSSRNHRRWTLRSLCDSRSNSIAVGLEYRN